MLYNTNKWNIYENLGLCTCGLCTVSCTIYRIRFLSYEIRFFSCTIDNFLRDFADFWRARSRLHQNEILLQNMRFSVCQALQNFCSVALLQSHDFSQISVRQICNYHDPHQNFCTPWTFSNFAKTSLTCRKSHKLWKILKNAYFFAQIDAYSSENERNFTEILPIARHLDSRTQNSRFTWKPSPRRLR